MDTGSDQTSGIHWNIATDDPPAGNALGPTCIDGALHTQAEHPPGATTSPPSTINEFHFADMSDNTLASRRLQMLQGHLTPSCQPQGCAAQSRVHFGRPASTSASFAHSVNPAKSEAYYAAAMRAAQLTLNPPKAHPPAAVFNAAHHQASPAFSKPAEDARLTRVTSDAMTAFQACVSQALAQHAGGKRAASPPQLQASSDKRMRPERAAGPVAGYALDVALPGVRPGDMVVEVGGGVLTVRGPRAAVVAELRAPLRVTRAGRAPWRRLSGGSLLRGGGRGTFQAQWPLPKGADEGRVSAEYDHGILRVRLAAAGSA